MIERGYRLKTQEELNQQVRIVSDRLGTDIVQPSSTDTLSSLSPIELQRRFPIRYKSYLRLLRASKGAQEPSRGEVITGAVRLTRMNRLDAYIAHHHEVEEDRVLRPKQIEAVAALLADMESGRVFSKGHFKLPPRFGKTVVFSELIKTLDVRTMVVVPTLTTGIQAEDELAERVDVEQIGRVFGGKSERSRHITITTYAALLRGLAADKVNPLDYELLILDEAHLSLSEARRRAVGRFILALKLGFTATSKYSEKKQLNQLLYPLIFGMETKAGIEEGMLCPVTVYESNVDTNTDLSNVRVNPNGDYDRGEVEKVVNNERRNQSALRIYLTRQFKDRPTYVFCAGVDHAESMAKTFIKHGVKAEVISGRNSMKEQQDILKRFRAGEIKVLCSSDLLTTGVNEPSLEGCINAVPTLSIVEAEQRGSRCLTLDPKNPRKHAFVVDIRDKNSKGVMYKDILEGKAEGAIATWSGVRREKTEKTTDNLVDKVIEVRNMHVMVHTAEALTVLEDLKKSAEATDLQNRITLAADTLVKLLGQDASVIAKRLPAYFTGRVVRVERFLAAPLRALVAYDQDPYAEIELPRSIFQSLVVDTVYQRLNSDLIIDEIPKVINTLNSMLATGTRIIPEVHAGLEGLNSIVSRLKTGNLEPEEKAELVEDFERQIRGFMNIRSQIVLDTRDKDARQIRSNLGGARAFLIKYRDNDQRVIFRKRIRVLMRENPVGVLNLLNAGDEYRGTEFYSQVEDIMNPATIEATINNSLRKVFTNSAVPENIFAFARELSEVLDPIKSISDAVASTQDRLVELLNLSTEVVLQGEGYSMNLYDSFDECFGRIIDSITQYSESRKGGAMSQEAAIRFSRVRKALTAHYGNVLIVRNAVKTAMSGSPELVSNLINASESDDILNSPLVSTLRKNPNFVNINFRVSQSQVATVIRNLSEEEGEFKETPEKIEKAETVDSLATLMNRALGF